MRRIAVGTVPLVALILLGWAAQAPAQGLIVDRRPNVPFHGAYDVTKVEVDADIKGQVAEVRVAQTLHNPLSTTLEAEYLFPLPDEGAIQDFVLMVDGRELPGEVMSKDEATRIFEQIVRSKKDPALLEYAGRGLIRTRVFPIPPHEDRKVTLRYTTLLKADSGLIEFNHPLAAQKHSAKPIDDLRIRIRLEADEPIQSLYSPSHKVDIDRDGPRRAEVDYRERDVKPEADFRLLYSVGEGKLGASVLSNRPETADDGYFLLLVSPEFERPDRVPEPKNVVLVMDRSGSMSGKKIEQARDALKFVLDNLRDGDHFDVVAYDDRVEQFEPELIRYDKDAREKAIDWVENLRPGGSTNIDDALAESLRLVEDSDRPSYVLFLTDGLPTAGETGEAAIAKHVEKLNREADARLFVFGVGYDVNARLLDRLSGGNGGASVYVKPDEDIEAKVASFYRKLTSPVLTDLAIEIEGTDLNRVYPRDIPDLFEGGQLVLVGRYDEPGETELTLTGKVGGERKTFRFPVELESKDRGSSRRYLESLWALRRVGFLIDQIDLHGESSELTEELITLSKKYGILTPYTAFLADENVGLHAMGEQRRQAGQALNMLMETEGELGVAQRDFKGALKSAEGVGDVTRYDALLGRSRAAAAAPAAEPRANARAMGGMPGLGRPGQAAPTGGRAGGAMGPRPASALKTLGGKTFFRKDGRWVESTLTEEEVAKAVRIVQFSDAYFQLARDQSAERNQFLTFEEPVVVKLGDKVYAIERPESK